MFLPLPHKKTDIYALSKNLLFQCYELTHDITAEEKGLIAEQIRKAALIAYNKITEALLAKKSKRKRKYFKTAVKAYIIVDAGLEMVLQLGWVSSTQIAALEKDVQNIFTALTKRQKK